MVSRIEKPRRRRTVFLLGLLFLIVFLILLGIGAESPAALQEFEDANGSNVVYHGKQELNAYHPEFELTPEHQVFWLDLRLSTGNGRLQEIAGSEETTMEIDLDLTVVVKVMNDGDEELTQIESFTKNVTQTCVVTEEWCNPVYIWRRDFIDYDKYFFVLRLPDPDEYLSTDGHANGASTLFDMRATVIAINPRFTRFEIGWKYTWFVATLLVMFAPCNMGIYWKLRKRRHNPAEPRTYHQRWTVALLWMLLWFNDPFAAAAVYTDWAKFFAALFIASVSMFVALILLFWLCFLSDLRFMQHRWEEVGRGFCYWVPKVVLTTAIGLTVFSGYVYYRFWDTVSPEYTGVTDEKLRAEEFAGLLGAMLAVYMLWVLILVLRSCGTLRRASPSYVLLFFVTLLTCLVAIIGVFVAAYYPYSTSGTAFVGIHGLMNMYVWTLAASFAPIEMSREIFPKDDPAVEMPTVVVGGTEHDNSDIAAWTEHADHDFKAVEL